MLKPLLSLRRVKFILLWICVSQILIQCTSSKNFTYFKDAGKGETIVNTNKIELPAYKIEVKDNLFVSIISSNEEMNRLYNPAISGTQTSTILQFEGPASQYINGFEVDGQGEINLPFFKKIHVIGLTTEQAEQIIQLKASEYLKDVTVKVKLLTFRVTVMGEVKMPGIYHNYSKEFSVLDAISMASGMNDYSKLNNVTVLRPGIKESKTFILDLNSKQSIYSEGFYLKPNDVVFVQPTKSKNINLRSPVVTVIFSSVSSILLLLNFLRK